MSKAVISLRCRRVACFSARKYVATSKTRSNPEAMSCCLYNWGDCARYASRSKYSTVKSSVPPSLADPMMRGVCTSVKPSSRR